MELSQPKDRWEAGAEPLIPQGLLALLGPSTGTSAPDHPLGSGQGSAQAQEQGICGAGEQEGSSLVS